MIVYSANRSEFTQDVYSNQIERKILAALKLKAGMSTSRSEIQSWKNSMQYMNNVLVDGQIPEDAGVAIEYKVPLTSKRVDFILTGMDQDRRAAAVIVELKQWSTVSATSKDAIVETFVGKAVREMTHPSYQAWTYASLILDFNQGRSEEFVLRQLRDPQVNNPASLMPNLGLAPAELEAIWVYLQTLVGTDGS